ncbi:MAG: viperin family antiviral radical SAM protein, partial [Acholeplasmataceae bacterium]|nr:viperin family antiviral radical SAM protein [Acholeplasmataceae bacterium]
MHYKINFHFTNKCDMACKHCFGLMNETEPSEVLEVFKQLKWLTNSVNLAGGEVFLNIDLLHSLIKQAVKDHLQVSIITNGLKLLNHLDDERVKFILKHIYQLGISIDSFKEQTNQCIGRTTLDLIKLKKLVSICNTNRVKVKINTVVSQKNMNEVMVNNIIDIHPNSWKIIQVFSQDDGILVNAHQFKSFTDKNKTDAIDIKIEKSEAITESYAMINGHGKLFLNSKVVDGFDLIPFTEEFKQRSSIKYSELLMESGFDQDKYFSRYIFNPQDIKLDVKKFIKKANKRVNQGINVLFIDVEGITPRPHQTDKYPNLTMGFKPVLFTGIILNEKSEIVDILSDYLNPKD